MQITAFGASDVPDVKISAQSVSRPGSSPASCRRRPPSASSRSRRARAGRVVGVGEAGATRAPRGSAVGDRREQRLVPRLGDHERRSRCAARRAGGARRGACG